MDDCEDLIRPALSSVLDSFEIEQDENACRVVTPFQHSNGDLVTLWVRNVQGDYYVVRDYGETFAMLSLYGVDPDSDTRRNRIDAIRTRFGLEKVEGELKLRASKSDLGDRVVDAIQAVQAVSHLTYTHRSQQQSRFRTKVEEFLSNAGYSYGTGFTVVGETHAREFDVSINHRHPTALIDTIHTNDKYNLARQVDGVMLNWHEIQSKDYDHGVIVDDVDGIYEGSLLDRLKENLDYFFRWSQREAITRKIPIKAE